jgi:hypothetical protein
VIATSPANGASLVLLNTTVTANFSSVMAPGTINTTTFTLTGPTGAVAGAVTYSGTTTTFTPATSLAALTLYTGAITTGATDPGGNALQANYVWTFTTAPPPSVVSTVPANLAIGMATIDSDSLLLGYPFSNREVLTAPRVLNPE